MPIPNRTEVIILQHPRERRHPIGTARIALLGLEHARLFTWGHKQAGAAESIESFRRSLPPSTVLLYPDPDAPPAAALEPRPEALLVIDGTWGTAAKMWRHVPWLADLPRARIQPARPGAYRLRREPRTECLSTVEAIVEALQALEPDTPGLTDLLTVFERMIDRQAPFVRARSRPRFRARPRRTPSLPAELLDDDNLVLVGGEYAGRERVYRWAAHRLATGDAFDCWLAPPPTPSQLTHMGVSEVVAVSLEEAHLAWKQFAHPGDIRVGWSERILQTSPGEGGIPLKRVYCGLRPGKPGHLVELVQRLEVEPPAAVLPGRVGERLAELHAVLNWLREAQHVPGEGVP